MGAKKKNKIYIIGVDAKGHVLEEGLCVIKKVKLMIGSKRLLDFFPDFEGKAIVLSSKIDSILSLLVSYNDDVAILASGDPNFFGIAKTLSCRFDKKRIFIIPYLSSIQYAFAAIKESWEDVTFISIHGRDIQGSFLSIRGQDKICIILDPQNTPQKVASYLLDRNVTNYQAYVCSSLQTEKEFIKSCSLTKLANDPKAYPYSILVLIKKKGINKFPLFGINDQDFYQRKRMITKQEVRAVILSKLFLTDDMIIWDIGAGTGAVSIEAGRSCRVKIYAIEKDKKQYSILENNIKRFRSINVFPIMGSAPDVLHRLPQPDRVFIGGSGGKLISILEFISAIQKKGLRIVITSVTVDSYINALTYFKKHRYYFEIVEVAISRFKRMGANSMLRKDALTPVTIITAITR